MANRVVEFPVPFALRKILTEKSSGELHIRGDNFDKRLFFIDGSLAFARTNVLHERLGEVLFKLGRIDQSRFWDIHKLLEGKSERIGKLLVDNQFISQKDLNFGLIYQSRSIAVSLFMLTGGEWSFRNHTPDLPVDSRFDIHLPGIIAEGVKKFKGLTMFRNRFIYGIPKARPLPSEFREFLTAQELALYDGLTGAPGLPLNGIMVRLKLAEDVFWTGISLFYFLAIIDLSEGGTERMEVNHNIEELLELHDRLKGGEFDYYQIFSLTNTANANDIKTAYFSLAKKFHPDRLGEGPDPELREKANYVFSIINKAYEVLSNEEKRREYDMRGGKAVAESDKLSENLTEKANILYRKAKTLYNHKRFWEGTSLLEEAVRHDPKANYYMLLGLCQANLPNQVHMAEKSYLKAVELDPWNAEAFTALGMLFMSQKMNKRAEGFFRKALSINPDHMASRKKLEEINPDAFRSGDKASIFSLFGKKSK